MNAQQQIISALDYEREVQMVDATAVAVVARQEIDVQISTAHRYPRSVKAFRNDVSDMATINDATAAECSYAMPRDGKVIEGPSVRFAEILLSSWGNCRSAARVVGDDGSFITAQGMFHDLQKNSAVVFEVRRRITNKHGKRFGDDMIGTTGNAAASIALRNAILRGIPKALWNDLWEQARKVARGDHKTLANRRAEAVKLFQGYGVGIERLAEFFGVAGIEEITTDHLLLMRGMVTAFRDGDSTPEQVFGDPQQKTAKAPPKSIGDRLDAFAAGDEPHDPETGELPDAAAPKPAAGEASAPSDATTALADDGADAARMDDKIAEALAQGRMARASGYKREAPKPYHYKSRADEAAAWVKGWDEEDMEIKAAEGGTV